MKLSSILTLSCALLATSAIAKETAKQTVKETVKESTKETTKAEPTASSDTTAAWGTNGGLTLGSKNSQAVNLSLHFGTPSPYTAHGYIGLEGHYIIALGDSLDLRVGGRMPLYPFGLAPEVGIRYHAFQKGMFHLAVDGAFAVPLILAPIMNVGVLFDPGVLMSVIPMQNLDVFFGFKVPIALGFYGASGSGATYPGYTGVNVGFDFRVGAAYNLTQKLGLFGSVDLIPGVISGDIYNSGFRYAALYNPLRRKTDSDTTALFDIRFKFGVQMKL